MPNNLITHLRKSDGLAYCGATSDHPAMKRSEMKQVQFSVLALTGSRHDTDCYDCMDAFDPKYVINYEIAEAYGQKTE